MLTRIRIEVEEATAEACVEALTKYEHAVQQQEARRHRELWPVHDRDGDQSRVNSSKDEYPTPDHEWDDPITKRDFYNGQLGREITEEVIAYDASLPGYCGRRVVVFTRLDMRHRPYSDDPQMEIGPFLRGVSGSGSD